MRRSCGIFVFTTGSEGGAETPQTGLLRACRNIRRQHGPALCNSDQLTPCRESVRTRKSGRVPTCAACRTRRRRCCIAQLDSYFESHDLRCSSKKARTCSGSSAPRNSTPAGSGSGQKTLSGVGTFGGLASMIFLLYKPIICLGPRFAPEPDAGHRLFVALTAQANNGTECLNRIYRLPVPALFASQSSPIFLPVLFRALSCGSFSTSPSARAHHQSYRLNISQSAWILCAAASAGFSS